MGKLFTNHNGGKYQIIQTRPPPKYLVEGEGGYTRKEIREGIKIFYFLPAMNCLSLDLVRVFPWLGKEWQDVFWLYSNGYILTDIGTYWNNVQVKGGKQFSERNRGNRIVNRLVDRIIFFINKQEIDFIGSTKNDR